MTPREHIEKRGLTVEDYHNAQKILSDRMFSLFDRDRSYNGRSGDSLMWQLSFTAPLVADRAMELYEGLHDKELTHLPNCILLALIENNPDSRGLHDLIA